MSRCQRFGALVLAALLPATMVMAEDAPAAVPLFAVDSETIDLGVVPEGEEVTAEFVVQNKGQAELRILKAKPS
ncbi:MAG: DUF1573 domain-containing protein [Acidobacteriota bacterium]|nr:DUF1573 domain-containing protein [Acidobacteriota bacterium]MDQ7087393.1 DUF1573 domain-containing protein [Acidobacteriota bacterium]